MQRLKLIWLALTAPKTVVHWRVRDMQSGMDWWYANEIRKELEVLGYGWELTGITVSSHSDNFDIDTILSFMRRAPNIMRRLINRGNADDELHWEQKP
jgi:hypothetical protein